MTSNGVLLQQIIQHIRPRLDSLSDEQATSRPAPGKWSPKEIIGHLIDSASNNHQRFVRAQFQEELVFPGYAQEAWVEMQGYQRADWSHLVALWAQFNVHLATVMEVTPTEILQKPRTTHNLHQIAWKTVPENEPTTLEYFMRDYIGHLENHLKQIFPDYAPLS